MIYSYQFIEYGTVENIHKISISIVEDTLDIVAKDFMRHPTNR